MFKVKGTVDGVERQVTYEDGKIKGDVVVSALAEGYAEAMDGYPVGISYQYTVKDHLSDPLSALVILLEEVYDEGAEVTGDIPEPKPVPDGAVV